MAIRIGTNHFPTLFAACRYYREYGYTQDDVKRLIAEASIVIGPPDPAKYGCTRVTLIDSGLRYACEEE